MNSIARKYAVAAAMVAVASAHGQLQNGGFEESGGSFAHWNRVGDTHIVDSGIGDGPVEGTHDALLATATDGTYGVPAGNGVTVSSLETGLGLAAGTLADPHKGTQQASGIVQTITLAAGQKISFSFDFLTNQAFPGQSPDANNNDYAFAYLGKTGSVTYAKLADTFSPIIDTALTDPFLGQTGFSSHTFTASSAGSYTFALGVVHASTGADNGINSGLLVDNVHVESVPEPGTCVFAIGGLAIAFGARRRRKTS